MLPRRYLTAVAVVTDVALLARGHPVAAHILAERQGRPPRHLEALLQSLVRHGILKGTRGPRGGYQLARERRRITVGDIVRLVDQEEDGRALEPKASGLLERVILPALADPSAAFVDALDRLTIEQLCRDAGECCTAEAVTAEFHI